MSYEILPGHTSVSHALHLMVLRPRFDPCDQTHPQAFDLNTTCLIRYNKSEGFFTTDVNGLPLRFEANYRFLDGRIYKIWINKSFDTYGKVSFMMDPVCSIEAKDIFMNIRGRHHKVSPAGHRMAALRRKASKNQRRYLHTTSSSNAVVSLREEPHVCSNSCLPVPYTPPEPVTGADYPIGTPVSSSSNGVVYVQPLQQIQPIAFVSSSHNTKKNSRKWLGGSDQNTQPLKVARN